MKRSPINKISKKEKARKTKYMKAKKEYLEEHTSCERCARYCITQIHHRAGRLGSLLWDKKNFMSLCQVCHTWAHNNPKEAMEFGFMVDRLSSHSYE